MAREQQREPLNIITFHPSPFPAGQEGEQSQAEGRKLRAAAYCRVSSESEEQLTSYLQQVRHYTQYLDEQEEYINCGIYADEGITGTSIRKRVGVPADDAGLQGGEARPDHHQVRVALWQEHSGLPGERA